MKKTPKVAGLVAIALLVSGIGFSQGAVQAHGNKAKSTKVAVTKKHEMAKPVKANPLATAATLLGLTEAELHTKLHATAGQTLAALATSIKGWTTDEFVAKLVEAETAKIDAQVTAGTLTSAKATEIKSTLSTKIKADVIRTHGVKTAGVEKAGKGNPFSTAATLLGLTEAELHTKLHATAGQTLAALATSIKGWTTDEFVAKLVEAETAKIDAQVTAGTLTSAKATEIKPTLSTKIKADVTRTHGVKGEKPAGAKHPKGKKGHR